MNSTPVKQLNKLISSPLNQMNNIEAQTGSQINISNCEQEKRMDNSNSNLSPSEIDSTKTDILQDINIRKENQDDDDPKVSVDSDKNEDISITTSVPDSEKVQSFNDSHPNEPIPVSTSNTQTQTDATSVSRVSQTQTEPNIGFNVSTQTDSLPKLANIQKSQAIQTEENVSKNEISSDPSLSTSQKLQNSPSELTKQWMTLNDSNKKKLRSEVDEVKRIKEPKVPAKKKNAKSNSAPKLKVQVVGDAESEITDIADIKKKSKKPIDVNDGTDVMQVESSAGIKKGDLLDAKEIAKQRQKEEKMKNQRARYATRSKSVRDKLIQQKRKLTEWQKLGDEVNILKQNNKSRQKESDKLEKTLRKTRNASKKLALVQKENDDDNDDDVND